MEKFNPVAIYNGQEEITREGKQILQKCIGMFNPNTDTLVMGFRMFESEFETFSKVKEHWFKYLTIEESKYRNRDYLDEDGIPYKNQEEWIHEVFIAVTNTTVDRIRNTYFCIGFGSDKKECPYSEYSEVFNKIFWRDDESITVRWNYFHQDQA